VRLVLLAGGRRGGLCPAHLQLRIVANQVLVITYERLPKYAQRCMDCAPVRRVKPRQVALL
jgi:hypothetical protein